MSRKNSDWDIDLRDGEVGESLVADLLHIDTVEVKTDRRWKETGNIYIEESCFQQSTQEWQASGVLISKATHWAFVLEDSVMIVPRAKLIHIARKYGKATGTNLQPNPSRGYLIRPEQLLEAI
jgi:hypothetical protein